MNRVDLIIKVKKKAMSTGIQMNQVHKSLGLPYTRLQTFLYAYTEHNFKPISKNEVIIYCKYVDCNPANYVHGGFSKRKPKKAVIVKGEFLPKKAKKKRKRVIKPITKLKGQRFKREFFKQAAMKEAISFEELKEHKRQSIDFQSRSEL